ncbi:MAG: phosphomannomutase/phosphoglucomutase [Candidatus Kerfeldbacteria bacterium]
MNLDAIFKAYDIRGVVPDDLNEDLVTKLGKAFATFVEADTVMVGHDMRNTSLPLAEAFASGVMSTGKNVTFLGLIPTDASYYAAGKYELPCVMFTASHNPAQWNGLKLTNAGAVPIGLESGLQDIRDILEKELWKESSTPGTRSDKNVIDEYIAHALSLVDVSKIKPFKVAIDAGNGMGGYVAPKLFEHLPCEVIPLYFELDGTMPNHEPNPIKSENVADLIEAVKKEGADIGLAFDGDADRVFFIDEKGSRVSASFVGAMVAKNMLKKNPGATIIYNAVSSKIVPETIEKNGGTAVIERVGHSFIKKTMAETGAVFATEHSGHYYFKDNYRADSGLITSLIVLEMLSETDKPFSELLAEFQKYFAIEETNSEVDDKDAAIARVKEKYADAKITELDGVTFEYDDYWFNVRPSNTEPVLRLNLEANTPELRDEKAAEVLQIIRG